MPKKGSLRCEDCKQFYLRKGSCAWSVPECTGPGSTFAEKCSLFTDQNGFAPLLDCPEEDLPAWYRQKELFDYEPEPVAAHLTPASDIKKKSRKKKRKPQAEQFDVLSHAISSNN